MSINNREDVNRYYHLINELVDDYIDKWKIKPSSLSRYLKPGGQRFNKFLMRNNLSELKGVDRILKDVIEDRVSMESDGVYKFESFNLLESNEFKIVSMKACLYKGIEKSTMSMEKAIADHFDTNLGSISVKDSDKHLFKIDDWQGDDLDVVIYNEENLEIIKGNFVDHIYDELSSKKLQITDSIEIELSKIIDYNSLLDKMDSKFDNDFTIKIITECLGDGFKFKSKTSHNNDKFFIWIK
jgi:hypothetical protein